MKFLIFLAFLPIPKDRIKMIQKYYERDTVKVYSVYFSKGSSELRDIDNLKQISGLVRIEINYNNHHILLSKKRANSIKKYLEDLGISSFIGSKSSRENYVVKIEEK